jgi:hypothetical protein
MMSMSTINLYLISDDGTRCTLNTMFFRLGGGEWCMCLEVRNVNLVMSNVPFHVLMEHSKLTSLLTKLID